MYDCANLTCIIHNGFQEQRTIDAESGSPESKTSDSNVGTETTTTALGRQLVDVDSFISNPREFLLQLPLSVKFLRIAFFPAIVLLVYICIMANTANTLGSFDMISLDSEALKRPLTVHVDSCDVLLRRDENQAAGIAIAVSTKHGFQADTTT